MTMTETKGDPVALISRSRSTPARIASGVLAAVGLVLPCVTSTAFGMSQSANALSIAPFSIIVLVLAGAGILAPGLLPAFSRIADIVTAAISVLFTGYLAYVVFAAWLEVSRMNGVATDLLRGMAGDSSELRSYADSYSSTMGTSVQPGVGLFLLALATVLMLIVAFRRPRAV